MNSVTINATGLTIGKFWLPIPLMILWAFVLACLFTGSLPAKRGFNGILRRDSPVLYWFNMTIIGGFAIFFTLMVNSEAMFWVLESVFAFKKWVASK